MKYLRLIIEGEPALDDVPRQSVAAATRHPTPMARSPRSRHHTPLVTDGPFAETRELLGGYQ